MPKSIDITPHRFAASSQLSMPTVPIYRYSKNIGTEQMQRGDETLRSVLRHMLIIREFESMLHSLRSTGKYGAVEFTYRGPAHLSIGQEAAAVGAALALTMDDHIYGGHRSHGEFIAKGLSAINELGENELGKIMVGHAHGSLLRIVENHLGGEGRGLSENFLLLGLLSEILMRACGFNGGMAGSMHAFFPAFGAYPNNAIVGGSAGIATGAALHKKLNSNSNSIAVATSGDGSTGCGPVWEAMNFASMAQFDTLWDSQSAGGLPVLFLFNNNFYAMGGQTIGETMAWDHLARIGAGINAEALHAETVDGTDPLAVADAVSRKRGLLLQGRGPALLDIECYRISGHSTSDANAYRSREELKQWQSHDAIQRYADNLTAAKIVSSSEIEDLKVDVHEQIMKIAEVACNPMVAPGVNIQQKPTLIGELMFSNTQHSVTAKCDNVSADLANCSRVRQNAKKSRFGLDDNGALLSPMRAITLRDALFESILHHMLYDDSLIAYGEECRDWGGAFGVYRGLSDLLPYHRLFNSPISEAAIVATAVGFALEGGRALVELMYADFIGRAGDEIFNQLAKWQSMSGGTLKVPVVLRCSVGSKYGAQHSQDWSSLVAHVPGLKILYPATPYDAKGLMASALSSNDPVVFFESQRLYDLTEQWQPDGVPEDYYQIPMGEPKLKRAGSDLTILTIGPSLLAALADALEMKNELDLEAEIIDARSLVPFNYEPVLESVKKTGHVIIVSESSERGSFAMTLAATITRYAFEYLKAPPRVLGAPNWIVPGAEMEASYFPQAHDIIDMVTREFYPEYRQALRGVRNWDDLALAKRGL